MVKNHLSYLAETTGKRAVLVVPSVPTIMREAQALIGRDVAAMLTTTEAEGRLSRHEALTVYRHIRALRELADEERIAAHGSGVEGLSDEELLTELLEHVKQEPALLEEMARTLSSAGGEAGDE